jgi:hypothetical protein
MLWACGNLPQDLSLPLASPQYGHIMYYSEREDGAGFRVLTIQGPHHREVTDRSRKAAVNPAVLNLNRLTGYFHVCVLHWIAYAGEKNQKRLSMPPST